MDLLSHFHSKHVYHHEYHSNSSKLIALGRYHNAILIDSSLEL